MLSKPEPRKKRKAREKRAESKAMTAAWDDATNRDGYCRLYVLDPSWRAQLWRMFGPCRGPGEFAHLGESRRFKTRGLPPAERHSADGGIKLCAAHHREGPHAYDRHTLAIEELTDQRANGRLRFSAGDDVYEEPE
jgi:hypothetical protein